MTAAAPPHFRDASDFPRAREVFARAGYTEDGLRTALAITEILWVLPVDVPSHLRRTRAATPLDTLIRLFFLGEPVDVDAARRAVEPMALERWIEASLVAVEDGQAVPRVKALPCGDLLLVADMPARIRRTGADDFVMGFSKSSAVLGRTMVPVRGRRALDLGTGSGALALLASPRYEHVHATDKNPRAVGFAAFNVRLNAVGNVACAAGDLFEPVAGHRFDLIISNPPYVIAPRTRYLFRDSGVRGDEFCRDLARLAVTYLEEGGYCQFMANWAHRAGQPWEEVLAGWFEGTGCDVIVWGAETQDAPSYATNWIQQTEADKLDQLAPLFDQWMSYFESEGIEEITYGLISMRRSSGRAGRIRLVKVPKNFSAPAGEHVLRRFALEDYLAAITDDRQLLDERFRLSPDVRIEQHYAPKEGGLAAISTHLHLSRDPAYYTMEADPAVATLVVSYRGERRLREVLEEMARNMGRSFDEVAPGGLPIVRRLVQNGYLLPSSVPD
jgi:methylase of polypeptide subunit release factors